MKRTVANELITLMASAIDTENRDAADLVLQAAESALMDDGTITLQDRADLQADYDLHFDNE